MIEFVPKELKENVNVSKGHPLKEALKLTGIILGLLLAIYLVLGFVVDLMVPHISPEVEISIGRHFKTALFSHESESKDRSAELQKIMDSFAPYMDTVDERLDYKIAVIDNSQVNAVALPGGLIVVFSGLLDKVTSKKEIAFVLAHELGHFHHRDHLKGLGRSLVMLTMTTLILGNDSSASNFISNSVMQLEMKFSRDQEKAADLFAVDLMRKRFGNADGAVAFMKKMVTESSDWKLLYYFSTHPHPSSRREYIEEYIASEK
ncbi:MAG: M48 family metallopeptidase [bacterium]|nr:M48 family metallopeptidase [bacterium]